MRPQRLADLLTLGALALLALSAYLTWVTADPGKGRPVVDFNGYSVTRAPVMRISSRAGHNTCARRAGAGGGGTRAALAADARHRNSPLRRWNRARHGSLAW